MSSAGLRGRGWKWRIIMDGEERIGLHLRRCFLGFGSVGGYREI
jgi:hypothetical protein